MQISHPEFDNVIFGKAEEIDDISKLVRDFIAFILLDERTCLIETEDGSFIVMPSELVKKCVFKFAKLEE